MYYQKPPQEPLPAAPSRREKKIMKIIDPRTGVNIIGDFQESSSVRWRSSTAEVS